MNKNNLQTIHGNQLRAARVLAKCSRAKLAALSGVSKGALSAIESGKHCSDVAYGMLRDTLRDLGVLLIDDGALSRDGGPGVRMV